MCVVCGVSNSLRGNQEHGNEVCHTIENEQASQDAASSCCIRVAIWWSPMLQSVRFLFRSSSKNSARVGIQYESESSSPHLNLLLHD